MNLKCPHCGWKYPLTGGLVPLHGFPLEGDLCPGSRQVPREIKDRRKLRKDLPVDQQYKQSKLQDA